MSTKSPKLAGIMRIPGYGEVKPCFGHSEAARTRGHGQEADSRLGWLWAHFHWLAVYFGASFLISPGLSSHIYKMEIIIIVPSPQACRGIK